MERRLLLPLPTLALVERPASDRSGLLTRHYPNDRNRRVSPIAPRPREGRLTGPTADAQPGPRERVLMPHTCPVRIPVGDRLS